MLFTLLAFAVALGSLIIFHELGHYWVARLCGVKVLRFSVGFGKVILRRTDRHGTEWALSALPLGGYVKMQDDAPAGASPAEAAGVQPGDVIVSVDGRPVASSADLRSQIGLKRLGRRIEIGIQRNGELLTLQAALHKGPQFGPKFGEPATGRLSGAKLRDLQSGDPLYGDVSGVVVMQVDVDSRADRSGLEAGDIILAANQVPVASVAALRQQLASIDGALALTIQRGSARLFLLIR